MQVRHFLHLFASISLVWHFRFEQVEALKCYDCQLIKKGPSNAQDPCFDPKMAGAPSIDCPTSVTSGVFYTCYKSYKKDDEDSDSRPFLGRGCIPVQKGVKPCTTYAGKQFCFCNDRDLCNDEPGYEVSKHNVMGSTGTVMETGRLRLFHTTLLALLSGFFEFHQN